MSEIILDQLNQNSKLVQKGQNDKPVQTLRKTVLWQKLLKTVCSGQNGFILARAA